MTIWDWKTSDRELNSLNGPSGSVWFPLGAGTIQMSVRVTKPTDLIPRGVRNYRTKLCQDSFKASSNAWIRNELAWILSVGVNTTVCVVWSHR